MGEEDDDESSDEEFRSLSGMIEELVIGDPVFAYKRSPIQRGGIRKFRPTLYEIIDMSRYHDTLLFHLSPYGHTGKEFEPESAEFWANARNIVEPFYG